MKKPRRSKAVKKARDNVVHSARMYIESLAASMRAACGRSRSPLREHDTITANNLVALVASLRTLAQVEERAASVAQKSEDASDE